MESVIQAATAASSGEKCARDTQAWSSNDGEGEDEAEAAVDAADANGDEKKAETGSAGRPSTRTSGNKSAITAGEMAGDAADESTDESADAEDEEDENGELGPGPSRNSCLMVRGTSARRAGSAVATAPPAGESIGEVGSAATTRMSSSTAPTLPSDPAG